MEMADKEDLRSHFVNLVPQRRFRKPLRLLVTTRLPWFLSIDGLADRVDTERGQLLRALFNYVHPAFTNAFGKDPETQDGRR